MPANEWKVSYAQQQIRVVKTSTGCARLYVDDELLDTTNDLYASEGEATMIGVFGENDAFRVEAFVRPSEHAEAEIRVNGEWVVGDEAYAIASD
jgi:hypothetical protein